MPETPLTIRLRERKMTQSELARRIGVTRDAVSKMCRGQCVPTVWHGIVIARTLRTTVEKLFGEPTDEKS